MRIALIATTWLVVVGAFPAPAAAYCRLTTEVPNAIGCQTSGSPLFWDRRCITVSVDERGSETLTAAEVQAVLTRSMSTWLDIRCDGVSPGFDVEFSAFSTCLEEEVHLDSGNVNTVAFVSDWAERGYDPAAFALTTTWFFQQSGEIIDADMQINDNKGDFLDCPASGCPPDADAIDLENTVTHEIGHFWGLAHSEDPEATMFRTAMNGDLDKRDLAADDVAGFCEAYGDASLPECDFAPLGGLDLNCEDDEGCGCVVPGHPAERVPSLPLGLLAIGLLAWIRKRHTRARSKSRQPE